MTFTDLHPTPNPNTATAHDVAGWYAAHALHLLGYADRITDEEGRGVPEVLHTLDLAAAEARTAYLLWAATEGPDATSAARAVLTHDTDPDAAFEVAGWVARWAGLDPEEARAAGYES